MSYIKSARQGKKFDWPVISDGNQLGSTWLSIQLPGCQIDPSMPYWLAAIDMVNWYTGVGGGGVGEKGRGLCVYGDGLRGRWGGGKVWIGGVRLAGGWGRDLLSAPGMGSIIHRVRAD